MAQLIPTVVTSKLDHIDYWSDVEDKITLPADTVLPTIFIEWLPRAAQEVFDILLIKYSAKKDTSGADNKITAGKITAKEEHVVDGFDAIQLINGEALVAANTKEGGDVHVGNINICGNEVASGIVGECIIASTFEGVTTTGASIELYDVQVGIRIYFT